MGRQPEKRYHEGLLLSEKLSGETFFFQFNLFQNTQHLNTNNNKSLGTNEIQLRNMF
jgi:hypothetical protein